MKNTYGSNVCVIIVLSLAISACDTFSDSRPVEQPVGQLGSERQESTEHRRVFNTQDSLGSVLLPHTEIIGIATEVGTKGQESILVLSRTRVEDWPVQKRDVVPERAGGYPVKVLFTGEIYAPRASSETTVANGAMEFARPVPIGVSTSLAFGATGTISARVIDGDRVFALSNNHVFAKSNSGLSGDAVLQPSSLDGGQLAQHEIGRMTAFHPIVFGGECVNTIDAAIASTDTSLLDNRTPLGGYGIPQSIPMAAAPGMSVQKYGRTSGLTEGEVVAINATVEVNYGPAGIACFTDQVIVTPGSFSRGGDSGSLVVSRSPNKNNDVRPVGLLFAGSETISVANDIALVLSAFGVAIDGDDSKRQGAGSGDNNHDDRPDGGSEDVDRGRRDDRGQEEDQLEADIQTTAELFLEVVDSGGNYVPEINICAWSSSTSSICGTSISTAIESEGDFNWAAELEGGQTESTVTLNNDTHYIIQTSGSINAMYYYREFGDGDVTGTFLVSDSQSESGSFSIINVTGTTDVAIVESEITNVSVGSPRVAGSPITVTWNADWSGIGFVFPDFMTTGAKLELVDGSISTLAASEGHASGSGSYDWTPDQAYTSVKIRVNDNHSSNSDDSSILDVESPISFTIDGPSSLDQGVEGTWSAEPTGGTAPYTFDWDYLLICDTQSLSIRVEECDTWNQGGTAWNWSHTVNGSLFDLKIRLTVSDASSPSFSSQETIVVNILGL